MAEPNKKKKLKGFKEFDSKKFINLKPSLEEAAKNGTVVIAWGRMNPMTSGHEKLAKKVIDVAKANKGSAEIYLTHSFDKKKNPLAYNDKINLAQKAFGSVVKKSNSKTIFQLMAELNKKYSKVILVAGSDRVNEFESTLNKYNGKEYNFDEIKVVSAGSRDPDADDVSGISGTKMREYAASDMKKFSSNLPNNLKSDADKIAALVRKGMNMSEEYEEQYEDDELGEALNRMQRRKRAIAMKRARFKIKRGREKAARKTASQSTFRKRARKAALALFKKKFSKGRYDDMSAGEKEIVDKRIEKISKKRIEQIAKKLLPSVRQRERDRRSAMASKKNESIEINEASQKDTVVRKKPHMLLNKEGKVKFDGRFKLYKKKVNESYEDLAEDLASFAADMDSYIEIKEGEKKGLWDNIHAKRKRIKAGSGEKMRKPGSKGAPTDDAFKAASESVELDEAKFKVKVSSLPPVYVDSKSAGDVKRDMRKLVKPEHLDDIEIERVQPSEIKKDLRARAAAKNDVVENNIKFLAARARSNKK
jgi:nicotinic acid mononucleotide adenylyltransferase